MRRHPANAYIVRWDAPKLGAAETVSAAGSCRPRPLIPWGSAACRAGRIVRRKSLVRLRALRDDEPRPIRPGRVRVAIFGVWMRIAITGRRLLAVAMSSVVLTDRKSTRLNSSH